MTPVRLIKVITFLHMQDSGQIVGVKANLTLLALLWSCSDTMDIFNVMCYNHDNGLHFAILYAFVCVDISLFCYSCMFKLFNNILKWK